jgi:hypothetical protein
MGVERMYERPANLDYHAVAATSGILGIVQNIPTGLVSLTVGMLGVALSRWVFVNRQYRETNRTQRWNETVPLTLVAMLVAGVLIYDRRFGVSTSAFVGLGVGWSAVLLLDVLGDWILTKMKLLMTAGPASPNFPKAADHSGNDGRVTPTDVSMDDGMGELLDRAAHALDEEEQRNPLPPK